MHTVRETSDRRPALDAGAFTNVTRTGTLTALLDAHRAERAKRFRARALRRLWGRRWRGLFRRKS